MSDIDYVLGRLRGLIGEQDPAQMIAFVHQGAPASKARARWSPKAKNFYTPDRTADAQKALEWSFRAQIRGKAPAVCSVAIVAVFYRPNRQRIDADNLMKLVMDAATKAGVWRDDCQVAAQAALVELDPDQPRTVIAFCPYVSTLDRRPIAYRCKRCGKQYERPEWYRHRNVKRGMGMYCSLACARPIALTTATCPHCDVEFQRARPGQRYCSVKCAQQERWVRLPNGEQRPPPTCEKCGGPVSKRGYRQCRGCRGYGRPLGSSKTAKAEV